MDRLLVMMKILRDIHLLHLATVGGFAYDLILANDRAWLALLDGDEDAVWQYANWVRCAYTRMEIPDAADCAANLAKHASPSYHHAA